MSKIPPPVPPPVIRSVQRSSRQDFRTMLRVLAIVLTFIWLVAIVICFFLGPDSGSEPQKLGSGVVLVDGRRVVDEGAYHAERLIAAAIFALVVPTVLYVIGMIALAVAYFVSGE